jgi:HPt (histidine-containing phosphotransfer) domain-containing protein
MAARNEFPSLGPLPVAGTPHDSAEPILDRAVMLLSVGNDLALLRELVEIFFAEAPGLQAQIRSGIGQGEAESVERAAHTLKGTLASFGALRARAVARDVELHAHEGRLADARPFIPQLEAELIQVFHALSDFLRDAVR